MKARTLALSALGIALLVVVVVFRPESRVPVALGSNAESRPGGLDGPPVERHADALPLASRSVISGRMESVKTVQSPSGTPSLPPVEPVSKLGPETESPSEIPQAEGTGGSDTHQSAPVTVSAQGPVSAPMASDSPPAAVPSAAQVKTDTESSKVVAAAPSPVLTNELPLAKVPTHKAAVLGELIRLEGGSFLMGAANGLKYEKPVHRVTVGPFWLSSTEVTVQQWLDAMGSYPGNLKAELSLSAEFVTWYEAVAYCNALSRLQGLPPAYIVEGRQVIWKRTSKGYRLPTEAEWEYAARGDAVKRYSGSDQAEAVAVFKAAGPAVPGTLAPNGFGFYDMSGNVAEWCWDRWAPYLDAESSNPEGPDNGTERVYRGGSWYGVEDSVTVSARGSALPSYRQRGVGLRVARDAGS